MFQSNKKFFKQFYELEYGSHKTDLFHTNDTQNCSYDIELLKIDFGYDFHNDMGYENIIVDKSIKNEIIYEYNKKRYISKEPLQYIGIIGFCDYHWVGETGDVFIGESGKIYRTCICKTYDNLFDMVYQILLN